MKKIAVLILVLLTMVSNAVSGSDLDLVMESNTSKFGDIKESDWYINTVSKLVGLGIIDGYDDGTFKPNGTIQVDEFIKLAITTQGHELSNGKGYWATPYINKAVEEGLVKNEEFADYKRPITRGEMARIVARMTASENLPSDIDDYKTGIKDFNDIPKAYQNYVLQVYVKGIITGYPDSTFKYKNNATRAEASTMIIRVIDSDERQYPTKVQTPTVPEMTSKLTEEDIKRLRNYEIKLKDFGYISFDDMGKSSSEYWIDKFYEAGFLEKLSKDLQASDIKFLTSNKTVYCNAIDQNCIRGVVRVKFNEGNLNTDRYYEADLEFLIHESLAEVGFKINSDGYKLLSDWKEVK